jgi:hypothetical protein
LLAECFGEELEVGLVVEVATVVAELEGGVEGVLDAGSELGGDGVPAECQLQALGHRALAGGEQGGRLLLAGSVVGGGAVEQGAYTYVEPLPAGRQGEERWQRDRLEIGHWLEYAVTAVLERPCVG